MADVRDLVERQMQAVELRPFTVDGVYGRRHRRHRNQRIRAGVLGLAIASALALAGIRATLTDPPVVDEPTPSVTLPPDSQGDTRFDIYVVDPLSGQTTLLVGEANDQANPERSPDGTRVLYESLKDRWRDSKDGQIFVLEPDGSREQLTDLPGGAKDPTWSPDGSQIAFVSDGDIFAMDSDGGNPRRLGGAPTADHAPDWSPDGSTIVFQGDAGQTGSAIWLLSVSSGTTVQLTDTRWMDLAPAWSPDGSRIAFIRYEYPGTENEDSDLWLMRADGTEPHRAVRGEGGLATEGAPYERTGAFSPDGLYQWPPSWSPDSGSIVIAGGQSFPGTVCGCISIVDVGTGAIEQIELPDEPFGFGEVSWSVDGTLLGAAAERGSSALE